MEKSPSQKSIRSPKKMKMSNSPRKAGTTAFLFDDHKLLVNELQNEN